ncbi:MAG: hypothetical protein C5B50_27910 [Verrucomicrobia bacterium]|nr:MAG: hypothetical protein C5B50_27910 [Verrucomicrobiota bacterium]
MPRCGAQHEDWVCACAFSRSLPRGRCFGRGCNKFLHTPERRVRAPGLQEPRFWLVGRVPSRGALLAFAAALITRLPACLSLTIGLASSVIAYEGARGNESASPQKSSCDVREGGIVRGPKDSKRIALVFTGHSYAEGAQTILDELQRHKAKASFFLTGDFLADTNFAGVVERIVAEGHYLGPHSDKHLLYCPWYGPKKTLVTRAEFESDLESNLRKIEMFGVNRERIGYFLPPFEHYNAQIVSWAGAMGLTLVNYTPGTRSNADYTGEADTNFVSSKAILSSILEKERKDPNGLNGFLLLLHVGSGPGRADKFHRLFGELLDHLYQRGYRPVRVDELLKTGS